MTHLMKSMLRNLVAVTVMIAALGNLCLGHNNLPFPPAPSDSQAEFISPLKTALSKGIVFANHTDFNVAPIDQLLVL